MLPAAFDVDRALADVHWLVAEVGPRVTGSPAEGAAAEGIAWRLREAGWEPQGVVSPRNLVACRGSGGSLFLAHVDSVTGSPGAGDNAAGVAILLELARTSQAEDLCLGFPVAEEVGLRGSTAMAAALQGDGRWLPEGGSLDQVVALDLVGWEGATELAANGLGTTWGGDGLSWLMQVARAAEVHLASPYGYRAMSRAAPWMERSDHAPFAALGLPALHLLHRGPHGVFPRYHQPSDMEASGARLVEVASLLEAMATAPSPPRAAQGVVDSGAFVMGRWRVPGWLTWGVLLAGLGAARRSCGASGSCRPCSGGACCACWAPAWPWGAWPPRASSRRAWRSGPPLRSSACLRRAGGEQRPGPSALVGPSSSACERSSGPGEAPPSPPPSSPWWP